MENFRPKQQNKNLELNMKLSKRILSLLLIIVLFIGSIPLSGVKVIAGIQSIEQLYEIYGESKARNIAAGFSSVFAFKSNDPITRDYISDLYGKNIVLEQYKSSNNTLIEEKREGKTVEDWHLNDLDIGQAVIGLPFREPFIFKFDEYKR